MPLLVWLVESWQEGIHPLPLSVQTDVLLVARAGAGRSRDSGQDARATWALDSGTRRSWVMVKFIVADRDRRRKHQSRHSRAGNNSNERHGGNDETIQFKSFAGTTDRSSRFDAPIRNERLGSAWRTPSSEHACYSASPLGAKRAGR